MAGNTFGTVFRLTTYGESHGSAIGGILDGCPAGLILDVDAVQAQLDRRRPGQSAITTQRIEADRVEFLSGIYEGQTTGTPIGFQIKNRDHHSGDYDHLKDAYRPSHADFTYQEKYGLRDHRGGGRSSARETANWVVAGAVAQQLLQQSGVVIHAYVSEVGAIAIEKTYDQLDLSTTDQNLVRCPDQPTAQRMLSAIEAIRDKGDTLGGVITCVASGVPVGLGQPVFLKLEAQLAHAMLSINATKGFEIGSGFDAARKFTGSTHNDLFEQTAAGTTTKTNWSGGTQGGISNGRDVWFKVAFKPIATIMQDQPSVNAAGDTVVLEGKGRHDPCVVPRAVPIVEAMTALVLADQLLLARMDRI